MRTHRAIAAILVAASCRSAEVDSAAVPDAFAFVLARYDVDRDGVVRRSEYDRPDDAFARLDRTGDGVLRADDFHVAGRRMLGMRPVSARRARARHLLAWYFQSDGDPHSLTMDEALDAWVSYDRDGNGRVGRREFEAGAANRSEFGRIPAGRWAGMLEIETTDPWERLVQGADVDGDGFLTPKDLDEFYALIESDEGWSFDPLHGIPAVCDLQGEPAPDFTLPTIDGDGTVRLADFAGDRAVALIFGSYT